MLTGLLTACTGVSDRSSTADAVTAGLRALSGVESATYTYSNDYTIGTSYSARVKLEGDADAVEVDAVAALYFSAVDRGDFENHHRTLSLEIDDDSLEVHSDARSPVDSAMLRSSISRWFTLLDDLPGSLDWSSNGPGSPLFRYRPGTGLMPAVEALRRSAPDLQAHVRWTLEIGSITVDWAGGLPDADVTRLAGELIAVGPASLVITTDTYGEPATLMLIVKAWKGNIVPESRARADLKRIAMLGRPMLYRLAAGDDQSIQVMVGGCQPGGSELEQRLTAEFGTC